MGGSEPSFVLAPFCCWSTGWQTPMTSLEREHLGEWKLLHSRNRERKRIPTQQDPMPHGEGPTSKLFEHESVKFYVA